MFFIKFFIALVVLYLVICIVVFLIQARLMYFPMKHVYELPSYYDMNYDEVQIVTKDNVNLNAWWLPKDEERGVILVCHGNGGNISHRLHLAKAFQNIGFSMLLFDYRGYGHSSGKPSEQGTYIDAEAAYDFLINDKKIDPNKIVAYGESLGSAVAIELATKKKLVAIIVEGAFTSVPDVAANAYFFLPVRLFVRYQYNSLAKINQLNVPILFIHSPQDDIIPYDFGKRLFNAYSGPKEFLSTSGGHNGGGFTQNQDSLNTVNNFLKNTNL